MHQESLNGSLGVQPSLDTRRNLRGELELCKIIICSINKHKTGEKSPMSDAKIRPECLRPAEEWEQPTGEEVREVLRLAGFTASRAASVLGLGKEGGRTIRRWIGEESHISYAAWALLCDFAGQGQIWKSKTPQRN